MNAELKAILDKSIEILKDDPRIIGAWHFGSVSKNSADEYSDVDPVFLVKKEYFDEVDSELPAIFRSICPQIHLWWAEGFNNSTIKNYAILVESGDLYQYDVTIVKESGLDSGMANLFSRNCKKEDIIFDKNGVVEDAILQARQSQVTTPVDGAHVINQIEKYWLYAFISIKYFKRKDIFKLIYAREQMRNIHIAFLRLLMSGRNWEWWAESLGKNLDPGKQQEMLSYFGTPSIAAMKEDFRKILSFFSKDAKELCDREGMVYPQKLEDVLMEYIDAHL